MPAQDPDEPFDLHDREGAPLGRSKPRWMVHRDGDWHRSLHLWVLTTGAPGTPEDPWVIFQRRSREKDTWPGALDVAVTGHLRAGEGILEALRESEEELGLVVAPSQVTRLGLRRREEAAWPGVCDRELQDIFFAVVGAPLASLGPSPEELDGVVALPLSAALALFEGALAEAPGARLPAGGASLEETRFSPDDLVPARDGYYQRALGSIAAHLQGRAVPCWELG